MSSKRDYTFAPKREYTSWADYFADYARNRDAVNNPEKPDTERGAIETLVPAYHVAEPPRSAAQLVKYADGLDFECKVLQHRERKFWNGEWKEYDVLHVVGAKPGSAFWARWVDGKPVESKVQINGGQLVWVKPTEAKKMLMEAE